MRICRTATVPFFLLHHLGGQIAATVKAGHEVAIVGSAGDAVAGVKAVTGADYHVIEIPRAISPLRDLAALWRLFVFFRRGRFDIVHSTTPKAGLLTAIAARLAGVPIRLHTFTGQAWAQRRGWVRWVARASDRLIVHLDTQCYADSHSQRDFLVAEGIGAAERIAVLGDGSLSGVDLARFSRSRRDGAAAARARLDIPAAAPVIGFIGRVTRDKGIGELVSAFAMLDGLAGESAYLVVVGPQEPELDPLPDAVLATLSSHPRVRLVGYTAVPEEYLAGFDLFCLPSYREGFGNVAIEAAAMAIPTVGTRIVGLTDAVVDAQTGILVPPKDAQALADALARLLNDPALRATMGEAAYRRAVAEFDADKVNARVLDEYRRLAAEILR